MTSLGIAAAALFVSVATLAAVLLIMARVVRHTRRPRLPLTAQRVVDAVHWTEAERDKRATQPRTAGGKFAKRARE